MDARPSLIHEFYGCLVLLRLLTPNRPKVSTEQPVDLADSRLSEWHVFLDSLAWMADHKRGGKTVTSIAVEPSAPGPIYWVVSNSPIKPEALQHLKKLLSDLHHQISLEQSAQTDLIQEIARSSIELSHARVRDYGRRLRSTVAAIDERGPDMTLGEQLYSSEEFWEFLLIKLHGTDENERKHLSSFFDLSRDPDRLIDLSMQLKRSRLLKRIGQLIQNSEETSLWKQVRHLLGRLCSWVRAARHLVLGCGRFRDRIHNAQVRQVDMSSIGTTDFQLPWREPVDILREIMPEFHGSRLQDALHARQNDKMVDTILLCLSNMTMGKFDADLHAEVIMLLHFHVHRLDFVAGDRYIGCSKLSCYCCDLYLRSHPAGVRPRRSHGNVWIRWAAPKLHADLILREANVLQDVVNTVKMDLRCQIMSGPTLAGRPPDSTTGLGSTERLYDFN